MSASNTKEEQLVIMLTQYPTPGQVKTRLARAIGKKEAAKYYQGFVEELVKHNADTHSFTFQISLDPPHKMMELADLLSFPVQQIIPQPGNEFEEKLIGTFDHALQHRKKVIIIGSDLPDLRPEDLEEAFNALNNHDVVIGPALDGGYYLIGLTAPHPEIFTGIPWSSRRTLEQTLDACKKAKLSVKLLEEKRDIDTVNDLEALNRK